MCYLQLEKREHSDDNALKFQIRKKATFEDGVLLKVEKEATSCLWLDF